MTIRRSLLTLFALGILGLTRAASAVPEGEAQAPPKLQLKEGPATADLGSGVAELSFGEAYSFADASETKRVLTMMGNQPSGNEVGLVLPKAQGSEWFVIFEWESVGYVKDEDKDKIDEKKLFESIREGTEQANKWRSEQGMPTLTVTGWDEKPHYDEKTHNLVWSLLARDSKGEDVVNYNVRLLGRDGYMSVTLVADPATLGKIKPELSGLMGGFSYKQGKRYAEWKPGDKVAKYGLAALVAGGAGVAAAKLGLFAVLGKFFAKAGKLIVVAVVALGAGLKKLWESFKGKDRDSSGVHPG